jgi:hypothetical protein
VVPAERRLVHLVREAEFRELRTDRNRYKITPAEQRTLRGKTIGVLGLSVGNTAALTIALEGIAGRLRVADFDTISLSNLNRLRAGVHELGVNKAILAARQISELDPYIVIEPFPAGVGPGEIDTFLAGLDLLVEECDDLYVKVAIRERARALRIPVVMDTSDRGLLDIERFDREPERPLLHGLIGDVDSASLRGLPTKQKIPFVLAILGGARISTRLAASLPEVKHTLATWPQLGSDVTLGGALVADAARRILLGELTASGRYYIDLEHLIRDGAGELATPAAPPAPVEISPEATRPPELPPRPARGAITPEAIRWLVAHATLAPSAHNAQPWQFPARGAVIDAFHDPSHDLPSLDFEHGATWLAFGAAAENLELAASATGVGVAFETFVEPGLVWRATLAPAAVEEAPLVPYIAQRATPPARHGSRARRDRRSHRRVRPRVIPRSCDARRDDGGHSMDAWRGRTPS